jgi:Peptidase M15
MWLSACDSGAENRDVTHFAKWQHSGSNKAEAAALQAYLAQNGVGNVLPLSQLLRSDTKWHKCGAEPFAVPPKTLWPHIIPTLKLIRDEVVPIIGPVEAQSVFRGPAINRCIKGASRSFHLRFHAIDMRPVKSVTRAQLIQKLCKLQAEKGKSLGMGLGIYRGIRFHIDTAGYRKWGQDHRAASSPCTGFVAPQRNSR